MKGIITMALGVKFKTVKTANAYTLEELFEAIKDKQFSAGQPSITKHGLTYMITFPALDSQNQVQIMSFANQSKPSQKWQIQKGEQAGMDNMVKNAVVDKLTGGLFGFGAIMGKNSKQCEALVETTVKEFDALGL